MGFKEKVKETVGKIAEAVDGVFPPSTQDELRERVWEDLSKLYYKYGADSDQQKAFREVLREVSVKLAEGKWESVYKKLYREEKK